MLIVGCSNTICMLMNMEKDEDRVQKKNKRRRKKKKKNQKEEAEGRRRGVENKSRRRESKRRRRGRKVEEERRIKEKNHLGIGHSHITPHKPHIFTCQPYHKQQPLTIQQGHNKKGHPLMVT